MDNCSSIALSRIIHDLQRFANQNEGALGMGLVADALDNLKCAHGEMAYEELMASRDSAIALSLANTPDGWHS